MFVSMFLVYTRIDRCQGSSLIFPKSILCKDLGHAGLAPFAASPCSHWSCDHSLNPCVCSQLRRIMATLHGLPFRPFGPMNALARSPCGPSSTPSTNEAALTVSLARSCSTNARRSFVSSPTTPCLRRSFMARCSVWSRASRAAAAFSLASLRA